MTTQPASPPPTLDYQRLAVARTALTRFQRQGEERARELGLTHAQYHLLLVVHTHAGFPPGVGHVARQLSLRQHSAAELIDRASTAGYVHRAPHPSDGRRVQLHLSALAQEHLAVLCPPQLDDLDHLLNALDDEPTGRPPQ